MKTIMINTLPGFEEWRDNARLSLQESLRPEHILWQNDRDLEQSLFSIPTPTFIGARKDFSVPKEFIDAARLAVCYQSSDRFSLLYRVLWRLIYENKNLLHYKTDDDILKLNSYIKAVRRDAYKIKAFLRFRDISKPDSNNHVIKEHYVAWYEPEHYSLELSLLFFQTRFKNMVWSILTPYVGAHWNGETLTLSQNPDPSFVPKSDEIEKYWLKYYSSTFNPARPKKAAMLNQMPKKYWKNMPETILIPDLLRNSEARARKMIKDSEM